MSSTGDGKSWASLVLVGFIFCGMLGNLLVCLAIYSDKRLQNVTNQFLFSLAIADLLVSILVMPFSIMIEVHKGVWIGNGALCTFYVYVDIFLCSASIVHMSIISLDRYMGIRYPLKPRNQSRAVVGIKILIVWLITVCITSPIAALAGMDESNVFQNDHCQVFNGGFIIYGSTLAFLIPLVIMVVTYIRTTTLLSKQALSLSYSNSKKGDNQGGLRRSTTLRRTNTNTSSAAIPRTMRGSSVTVEGSDHVYCESRRASCLSEIAHSTARVHNRLSLRPREPCVQLHPDNPERSLLTIPSRRCSSDLPSGEERSYHQIFTSDPEETVNPENKHIFRTMGRCVLRFGRVAKRKLPKIRSLSSSSEANDVATEQKATRVLGIVFLCFFICWTPFFTINFLQAFCHFRIMSLWKNCSVPGWVASLTLWLGYISSTLNPVIYTVFNRRFRQAFMRILKCQLFRRSTLRTPNAMTLTSANGNVHSLYNSRNNNSSITRKQSAFESILSDEDSCLVGRNISCDARTS